MASSSKLNVSVVFFFLLSSVTLSTASRITEGTKKTKSFTIELSFSGSHRSPSYHQTWTPWESVKVEATSSISRLRYLSQKQQSSNGSIESDITSGGGGFEMTLAIGTPPIEFTAVMDTGSDLIWTQCQPCQRCFQQPTPIFDPSGSKSYYDLGCASKFCNDVPANRSTCDRANRCHYQYAYGDQSFTTGVMASETLTFDSTAGKQVQISRIGFGCGHNNNGTFSETSGIVGMGRGPLSLISQLGDSVANKFSYCLVPRYNQTASSWLKFGTNADFSGSVQQTPLVQLPDNLETFYYLTLNDISVGNQKLNIPTGSLMPTASGGGGFIIDSGTTLTLLASDIFNVVASALKNAITVLTATTGPEPFALCYSVSDPSSFDFSGLPTVTFHFDGGANWVLRPEYHFVALQIEGQYILCSSFVPSRSLSIFGNVNQQNMYVEYDLGQNVLSFTPTDCTNTGN